MRAPCKCGCGQIVPRLRSTYLNRAHEIAHKKATGQTKRYASLGGKAGAKSKQVRAIKRAAQAVGRALTPAEAAIYRKGYTNGYTLGYTTGRRTGYAEGWAEALGEKKGRAA